MYAVICCTQTLPGSSKLKQTGPLVAWIALPLQQPISGPDNSLTFLPNAPGWLYHTHHYQHHSQLHQIAGNCLPGTCSSLFQEIWRIALLCVTSLIEGLEPQLRRQTASHLTLAKKTKQWLLLGFSRPSQTWLKSQTSISQSSTVLVLQWQCLIFLPAIKKTNVVLKAARQQTELV